MQQNKKVFISNKWDADKIQERAASMRVVLTEEEAISVINHLNRTKSVNLFAVTEIDINHFIYMHAQENKLQQAKNVWQAWQNQKTYSNGNLIEPFLDFSANTPEAVFLSWFQGEFVLSVEKIKSGIPFEKAQLEYETEEDI